MSYFRNPQLVLDEIADIVCKDKQAEIESYRQQLKLLREEARDLCNKYSEYCSDDNKSFDLRDAHDLYDFLMSI